ncbi:MULTISPECIES: SRPBCC family protein [unclassified Streptomyces]|uniref:SRPBCC family protein n=1 Tax=unclassified Streptomyces TaxID=2593676 RepID=UPI0033CB67AF
MTRTRFTTTHEITAAAEPERLFDLVADPAGAPRHAPSQMHAELLEHGAGEDVIKRWVYAERGMRAWTFRRRVDRAALRVVFTHVDPVPPVLDQRGTWTFEATAGGGTLVRVQHVIVLSDAAAEAGLRAGFDQQVPAQLAGYKAVGELGADLARRYVTGEESALVAGTADDVRARLVGTGLWAVHHPEATGVTVTELGDDAALLEVTGAAARYFWLRPNDTDIVYKSLNPPEGLHAQTGRWRITQVAPDKVEVVLRHTVTLPLAGAGPDPETLREPVRAELRRLLSALGGTPAPATGGRA